MPEKGLGLAQMRCAAPEEAEKPIPELQARQSE
jgi:hypothetical protein